MPVTPNADIYMSGLTEGALFGMNKGGQDAFVMRIGSATSSWQRQFGGPGCSSAHSAASGRGVCHDARPRNAAVIRRVGG